MPLGDFPMADAAGLLTARLAAGRRTLTPGQRQAVLAAFSRCPRPLFLALAAEEAKLWRSDEAAPTMPEAGPPETMLAGIIGQIFDRLSEPANHGKLLVERALGYLAAAKNGLTEGELLDLLSSDREFFDGFLAAAGGVGQPLPAGVEALPAAVWVRLYADLKPYLTSKEADGVSLLAFYHRSLEGAARGRFLAGPQTAARRHQHVADYFARQELFRLTPDEQREWAKKIPPRPRPVNARKVAELPHHLLEVAKLLGGGDADSPHWRAVADLLLDVHFLEAVAEAKA